VAAAAGEEDEEEGKATAPWQRGGEEGQRSRISEWWCGGRRCLRRRRTRIEYGAVGLSWAKIFFRVNRTRPISRRSKAMRIAVLLNRRKCKC
jgi:hypothetical protein